MPCVSRHPTLSSLVALGLAMIFAGCDKPTPTKPAPPLPNSEGTSASGISAAGASPASTTPGTAEVSRGVMLGIDVLEAEGFAAVRGKRIGLLTHPAGVNRRGESTIDVLRRAPQTTLTTLFAPEHGLYGREKAGAVFHDAVDPRTGLPVYSLHGDNRKPTSAQLKGLDALLIDLQDIGVRSYTFSVVMRYAMDACFAQGVEVIVLDRPNPLGGLKVDGPLLDREWRSGVGACRIPYVHGLTMGELARFAAGKPGELEVSEAARTRGKLTVIPMRGWRRSMRWPDTGLAYVPTSQNVRDFAAIVGYAMIGLGCQSSGFAHGLDTPYPFRCLSFKGKTTDQIERDLNALQLPGLRFSQVPVTDTRGKARMTVFAEVTDWEAWNPTELSFHLMRLACRYRPPNPFAKLKAKDVELFNKHVGSSGWWRALKQDGAAVDVEKWVGTWQREARAFQEQSRKFWLYE
jgi:uncharacterized protein YbbC (DUF1343 family)